MNLKVTSLQGRGRAPIVVVPLKVSESPRRHAENRKWPGADGMTGVGRGRLRRHHDEGAEREGLQQAAGAAAQGHLEREGIDGLDAANRLQLRALRIHRAGRDMPGPA